VADLEPYGRPLGEGPGRCPLGADLLARFEVVVNGRAAGRAEVEADGAWHDVALPFRLERSSWVVLRVYPSSHTNPVFVTVGDRPIRASKASARWSLEAVDRCWGQKVGTIGPAEVDAAKAAYEAASAAYRAILEESADD